MGNKPVKAVLREAMGVPPKAPVVVGKITAISGTTVTIAGRMNPKMASSTATSTAVATTTYSVNAATAIVIKGGATTTVGSLMVGEVIEVRGTVSGNIVTATTIHAGKGPKAENAENRKNDPKPIGSGEPVIAGVVGAVSSTTITVNTNASTTYTVDATNAKIITKKNASSTLSSISVGDKVVVQGTVSGSNIVATNIYDGVKPGEQGDNGKKKGFFGNIGGFLKRLFGF